MLDRPIPTIEPLAPPARSIILRPGMPMLPPGIERYRVEGGQTLTVELEPGDRITVTDVDGGQVAERIALDETGRPDPGVIGERIGPSGIVPSVLGDSTASLRERLKTRGIDLSSALALRVFGNASPAGTSQSFTAERRGTLIVSAPGATMPPEDQDTATPIELRIERGTPPAKKDRLVLPDPLADPLQDIRVNRATGSGRDR